MATQSFFASDVARERRCFRVPADDEVARFVARMMSQSTTNTLALKTTTQENDRPQPKKHDFRGENPYDKPVINNNLSHIGQQQDYTAP